jgi:hypothetical protein
VSEPPRLEPLRLAELLGSEFDPTQYKLHCARRNPDGEDPLDVYAARRWDAWVGWNTWRSTRNDFTRPRIFAVMQVAPASNEWVYGGAFDVVGRRPQPNAPSYDIELVKGFTEPMIGRLRLRFWPAARGRSFKLETYFSKIEVVEIAREPWAGRVFPGIDSINHSFRELEVVVRGGRDDWRIVLDNLKGVYVWNDRLTGKASIGSATADSGGLWSRLGSYILSGHAGNKLLRELVGNKGMDYLRQHFSYALLEYWPMRVDDDHVRARESYWKDVFGTREHGYNAN